MILIDTSAPIDTLTGPRRSAPRQRRLVLDGERIRLTALALFEWRRGPRLPEEIADQESLFPSEEAIPFGSAEGILAADLYRKVRRPRGRAVDIAIAACAIAACAIAHNARLWIHNPADFKDIPNLKLL